MKISAKKAIIFLIIFAVIGMIVVFSLTSGKVDTTYATAIVERANITQTVNETGTVKAVNELELSLLNSGEISKINYKIGDKVKKDDILLELDYSSLVISKEEAAANLIVAQQNLNKLLAGATKEEVDIAKAGVNQAKVAYDSAVNDLDQTKKTVMLNKSQAQKTLSDLESSASDNITTTEQAIISAQKTLSNTKETYQRSIDNLSAVALSTINDKLVVANNALDAVNNVLTDDIAEDYIGVKTPGTKAAAELKRKATILDLNKVNTNLLVANSSPTNKNVIDIMTQGLVVLNSAFDTLELTYTALDNSLVSASFTQTALDAMKTTISAQQSAVAGAITAQQGAKQNLDNAILAYNTNVSSAENNLAQAQASYDSALTSARNALESANVNGEQQITSAQSRVDSAQEAWQVAQAQLNRTTASPDRYDRSLLEARITQAQATLNNVNKQIENSIIKAPIDGTITKINYDIGEQVLSGSRSVISILGDNDFEIEVMISEADISKIEKGDPAHITLDAYGDDVKFEGAVSFVEPAETIIQDVIYYKVSINFTPGEQVVKSGMTANITITTDQKDNVMVIPARAVIDRNGSGKIVRVLSNGEVLEKTVTVGLRGDEGLAEILTGLNENDEVVTFINKD